MTIIKEPNEAYQEIKLNIKDFGQENIIALFLDTKHKVIKTEVIFKGGLNACLIDPRTFFRIALTANAASFIVAHNHPSGDLEPSNEDIDTFRNLKEAAKILTMPMLDCLIFSEDTFLSFKERI
jgi:DNA repair protein RadC